MSIQTVERFELPRMPENISTFPNIGGAATLDITGLGGGMSYIWQMPYSGFIDSLFFKVFSAGGTTNYLMRADIETVDINQGLPTGLLISPSASAQIIVPPNASPVNYEVRFPQPFEIPQGQHFAINIYLSSGGIGGTGLRFAVFDDDNHGNLFPYVIDDSAPPATPGIRNLLAPCIGIGLSAVSATPLPFCWPVDSTPNPGLSFAAPNIHGNKITINSPVRVCGATIWGQVASVSSVIILYATNGTTALARQPWHYNLPNSNTITKFNILFDQPVNLNAGTYYLAVSGGTGSTVTMYYANFTSSFWRMASPMGGNDVMAISAASSPANQNSWTSLSTRQVFMGLLVDGIDDGISVGGGETSSVFFA